MRGEHKFLSIIFILSFVVRLLFFHFILGDGRGSWYIYDSNQYHQIAQKIEAGEGICNEQGKPNFYRLPGFPLFLALAYKLFNFSLFATMVLHIFLTSMIPILMFFLSLSLFPQNLPLAHYVALFSCFHVGFVLASCMILTEALFLVFFLEVLIIFFRHFYGSTKKEVVIIPWMGAGLLLGCASLIRPVGHYLIVLMCVMVLLSTYNWISKLKVTGLLLMSWLVVVTPWLLRNFLLTGSLFFHTLPGMHFMQYLAVPVYMSEHSCSESQARSLFFTRLEKRCAQFENECGRTVNEYDQCVIAQHIANTSIFKHPWIACKCALIQICKTLCALHVSQLLYNDQGWPDYNEKTTIWDKMKLYLFPRVTNKLLIPIFYFDIFSLLFMLVGSLMFVISACWDKQRFLICLRVVPIAGLIISMTLAYGSARLRLPVEPLMMVFSGLFWLEFFKMCMHHVSMNHKESNYDVFKKA